jgi:hypothetical protein
MTNLIHKLGIRGATLRRTGDKRTIALADAHNRRLFKPRGSLVGKIDPTKSHLNIELIKLTEKTLEATVFKHIDLAGVDLTHRTNKRKDKGFANEYVFGLTPGFKGDCIPIFSRCLTWLEHELPTCPIVHAVVHFDEGHLHMHVIVVPIIGSRLPASDLIWYGEVRQIKELSLYQEVSQHFGLGFPGRFNGAAKQKLALAVIHEIKTMPLDTQRYVFEECLEYAIYAYPENFIKLLKLDLAKVFQGPESNTHSSTLSCVGYKNGDIPDVILPSDMYQFANNSSITRISI